MLETIFRRLSDDCSQDVDVLQQLLPADCNGWMFSESMFAECVTYYCFEEPISSRHRLRYAGIAYTK